MDITDIRIRKVFREGKLKAIVSVTFDDSFVVHDIKVIQGNEGLFISMPSRKTPEGEYKDIVHPINSLLCQIERLLELNIKIFVIQSRKKHENI